MLYFNTWFTFWSILCEIGPFLLRNGNRMSSILQRVIAGFILSRTNISFRVTKYGTKLPYSLLLQKYISLCDNHFTHRLHNLKATPIAKYRILTIARMMAYGGQHILFNFCIIQIELKLNAKYKIQIHQWHVSITYFVCVQNIVKCFMPYSFKILQLNFWWYS